MDMLKEKMSWIPRKLVRLHRDESGAEMLEYILIVAVVALPMVGILLWFRDEITDWVKDIWEDVRDTDVDRDLS